MALGSGIDTRYLRAQIINILFLFFIRTFITAYKKNAFQVTLVRKKYKTNVLIVWKLTIIGKSPKLQFFKIIWRKKSRLLQVLTVMEQIVNGWSKPNNNKSNNFFIQTKSVVTVSSVQEICNLLLMYV